MNLYLLIALAFGALTGGAGTPVVRPSVILSEAKDLKMRLPSRQRSFAVYATQDENDVTDRERPRSRAAAARSDRPLTGASTPRAPATIG